MLNYRAAGAIFGDWQGSMTLGFSGDPDIDGDHCCLGLWMVGSAARPTPTDCGLVLTIGRTYSGRNLVDVLPRDPPQRSHHLRLQTRLWGPQNVLIWVGPRMIICCLVTLEHWMRRAGGAPMLGRAGPSNIPCSSTKNVNRNFEVIFVILIRFRSSLDMF